MNNNQKAVIQLNNLLTLLRSDKNDNAILTMLEGEGRLLRRITAEEMLYNTPGVEYDKEESILLKDQIRSSQTRNSKSHNSEKGTEKTIEQQISHLTNLIHLQNHDETEKAKQTTELSAAIQRSRIGARPKSEEEIEKILKTEERLKKMEVIRKEIMDLISQVKTLEELGKISIRNLL